jgi:hypothetical protein
MSNNNSSNKNTLKNFLELYFNNINESAKHLPKNDINLKSIVNDELQTLKDIYKIDNMKDLFIYLKNTVSEYKKIIIENNKSVQDAYILNLHGQFDLDKKNNGFKKIPANTVLIFETPVNRFGICYTKEKLNKLIEYYKNKESRQKLLSNIHCVDKFNSENSNNSKDNNKKKQNIKLFKNALILFPGQYYYDLQIEFDKLKKSDETMNIHYFNNDQMTNLINTDKYDNLLSNLVEQNKDKIKYIFVRSCRNIDYDISSVFNINKKKEFFELGKKIYTYEIFSMFFNTLMLNCKNKILSGLESKFSSYRNFQLNHIIDTFLETNKNNIIKKFIDIFKKYGIEQTHNDFFFDKLSFYFKKYIDDDYIDDNTCIEILNMLNNYITYISNLNNLNKELNKSQLDFNNIKKIQDILKTLDIKEIKDIDKNLFNINDNPLDLTILYELKQNINNTLLKFEYPDIEEVTNLLKEIKKINDNINNNKLIQNINENISKYKGFITEVINITELNNLIFYLNNLQNKISKKDKTLNEEKKIKQYKQLIKTIIENINLEQIDINKIVEKDKYKNLNLVNASKLYILSLFKELKDIYKTNINLIIPLKNNKNKSLKLGYASRKRLTQKVNVSENIKKLANNLYRNIT